MTDIILHALGGAALALVALAFGEPEYDLALLFPLLLGYERERVQLMVRDVATHASHWRFWRWQPHHLIEWLAWPLGAIVSTCGLKVFG